MTEQEIKAVEEVISQARQTIVDLMRQITELQSRVNRLNDMQTTLTQLLIEDSLTKE